MQQDTVMHRKIKLYALTAKSTTTNQQYICGLTGFNLKPDTIGGTQTTPTVRKVIKTFSVFSQTENDRSR